MGKPKRVLIIRTDGSREMHSFDDAHVFREIERLIGASCLDHVSLRDGRIMWVDDNGYETHPEERDPTQYEVAGKTPSFVTEIVCDTPLKPYNDKATELYHSVCKPGTTHRIVGDVAITYEEDWNGGEEEI